VDLSALSFKEVTAMLRQPNRTHVDTWLGEVDRRNAAYITWVQRELNRLMQAGLSADGVIGPRTRAVVRAFQRQKKLIADGVVGPATERALIAAGASSPTGGVAYGPSNGPSHVPTPSTALNGGAGAKLRSQIATTANTEWERWKRGTIKEGDPAIRSVLAGYWKDGVGWLPSGSTWWSDVAGSAAFISWVVKKAGAGNSFKYSSAHAVYTAWAKQNKLSGSSSPFQAYRVTEVAPRVGDIVCKDRGSGATYDNIREGMSTHCDIVVEVQPGKLTTIGGNLSDSVRTSPVTTDAQGRINQRDYFAVIRVGDGIPGGSSSEIDRLGLAPDVAEAARILKMKSPGVKFTSGRRGIHDQAHAMAVNIVKSQNRKWIAVTYASAAKLQQWVDEHPEAKSVDAIAQGLEGVMNGMSESELLKVSLHLSGRAFDIQPGSAKEEDIYSLPGLKKFLKKEGGLVIWHLQF
jgi:peptidoglycan hydrolase-like protein with peptidoglycan-binding domain